MKPQESEMPKPITMLVDVEEVAAGKIWRTLDAMNGVVSIKIKGEGPRQVKPNGKGNGHTAQRLILDALRAKSPLHRSELQAAIEAGGKQKTSLPQALSELKKGKRIIPLKAGLFKITAAGKQDD